MLRWMCKVTMDERIKDKYISGSGRIHYGKNSKE